MHLDEERVQRLLDGELSEPVTREAREHLLACADCRERCADAERVSSDVDALLRSLDHPRAHPHPAIVLARRTGVPGWARLAAGIVLAAVVAGTAYAAPGSPLPRLLKTLIGASSDGADPIAASTPAKPAQLSSSAGIAVPAGTRLVIDFAAAQGNGDVHVSLTDRTVVTVRGPRDAAAFTSADEHLMIDNRTDSATYEIDIPRSAPRVEIRVAGATVFLKVGDTITGAERQSDSRFVLSFSRR